jgi:hypothetical protein
MSPCHGEDHGFDPRMFRHWIVAQRLEQAPYKGEKEVQLFPIQPRRCRIMVIPNPSKVMPWVRFPSPTPNIKLGGSYE